MAQRIQLAEIQNLPDALTNEAFTLMFASIPGESDNKRLTLQCQSTSLPAKTNTKVEFKIAGFQRRQSGLRTWDGELTITFLETRDMAILKRLRTWDEYCRGTNSGISVGYSEDYTRTGEITVFDSKGEVATSCKVYKMFPTNIPAIDLDSTGEASPVTVAVSFSYDYAEFEEGTTL